MPPLSAMEEVQMRGRTLKMLSDLTGKPIEPTEFHRGQAVEVIKHVADNKTDLNLTQYPNETIAYLSGMVAQYDHMIVRELADLKLYVVNKLLSETDNPDAKIRVAALKALGDVDGVDAFKTRTEVTHKIQPIEEVERELLETLNRVKSRAIDVVAREVPNATNP
jgi:HEAT repeat protein